MRSEEKIFYIIQVHGNTIGLIDRKLFRPDLELLSNLNLYVRTLDIRHRKSYTYFII